MATVHPRAVALTMASALLALFGVSATPTADAVSPAPMAAAAGAAVIPYVATPGPLFTRPPDTGGTREQEIAWNLVVERLLDATPAGATVTGSLFSLTAKDSQAALKRAHQRGVKVRLLLYNNRADDKNVRSLVRALNDGKTRGSWAKVCKGSCYGSRVKKLNPGVQHFKGFTFTTVMETPTQAATNVWTAGSGNLTNAGSGFNSYVVGKGHPAIVAYLNGYMTGMKADKESRPTATRVVTEGGYKLYLYPQRKLSPDPIINTLRSTTCVAPPGYGINGRTVVRVGMFAWTHGRDIDDELVRLHRAGCDVGVLISAPTIERPVLKRLIGGKVPMWNVHTVKGKAFYYIHDKNLIVDGASGGKPFTQVLSGSNNFTDGGLIRNTESVIETRDKATTDEFLVNWNLMRDYSRKVTKLSQLSGQSTTPLDPENMEPIGE